MIRTNAQRVPQSASAEWGKIAPKHKYRFLLGTGSYRSKRQYLGIFQFAIRTDPAYDGFDADVTRRQAGQIQAGAHGYRRSGGYFFSSNAVIHKSDLRPFFDDPAVPAYVVAGDGK